MPDLDHYRYKAEGTLDGAKFLHEGEVYAEHSWDAAELAEAEVRAQFPGVTLKNDDLAHGITSSPRVFVTRDVVNRAVARGQRDIKGNLLRVPLPKAFRTGIPPKTTIERQPHDEP